MNKSPIPTNRRRGFLAPTENLLLGRYRKVKASRRRKNKAARKARRKTRASRH